MKRNIIVQKFGGTSVADTAKIKNVAKAVIKEKENGNDVVVVVSAMGHTTDYLVKLAKELNPCPPDREMDMLLSTGEGVSIALLAIAIQAEGYQAESLNAMQIGIHTENIHMKARITDIETARLDKALSEGKIVVVAGFQGITEGMEITTLGRGGSDISAVALAAALNAKRCDIYTDVQGVYTTDPRIVPTASKLDEISYEEMLELAQAGANVLHPRSVEAAKVHGVEMRVRSSFKLDDLGTLILGVDKMEINKAVTGIAGDLSQARVVVYGVPDKPGHAAAIFSALADAKISVDMIIQSHANVVSQTNDIAFTVNSDDVETVVEILNSLKPKLNFEKAEARTDIAKVSAVGAGMIGRPGIASKMFQALADAGINIRMISTSEVKISCLVNKEDLKKAIQVLHTAFELDCDIVAEVKGDLPPEELLK